MIDGTGLALDNDYVCLMTLSGEGKGEREGIGNEGEKGIGYVRARKGDLDTGGQQRKG